jgi:hypothetical protein
MPRLTLGKVSTFATIAVILLLYAKSGGKMFSTGPLSAKTRANETHGGVMSHAQLEGKCGACHASPLSRETMADRCLECHTNVREQLDGERAMHGRVPNGKNCRSCHTEHKGAKAEITSLAGFDHEWTSFSLTGKHLAAECQSCHKDETYHLSASTCVSCHATVDKHKGSYGSKCEQCHKATAWAETSFKHRFPIQHGSRRRQNNTCATCHADETNLKSYTCYNCHEHREEKMVRVHRNRRVANLSACAECHRMGGKRRERAEADQPVPHILANGSEAGVLSLFLPPEEHCPACPADH